MYGYRQLQVVFETTVKCYNSTFTNKKLTTNKNETFFVCKFYRRIVVKPKAGAQPTNIVNKEDFVKSSNRLLDTTNDFIALCEMRYTSDVSINFAENCRLFIPAKTELFVPIAVLFSIMLVGQSQAAVQFAPKEAQRPQALSELDTKISFRRLNDAAAKLGEFYEPCMPAALASCGKFEDAVVMAEQMPDEAARAITLAMLSAFCAREGRFEQTTVLVKQAEKLAGEIDGADWDLECRFYANLAASYNFLGDVKKCNELVAKFSKKWNVLFARGKTLFRGDPNQYEQMLLHHKKMQSFVGKVFDELIQQRAFDAAVALMKETGLPSLQFKIELERAIHILKVKGEKEGAAAFLNVAVSYAKRNSNRRSVPKYDRSLAIQVIYWLVSHDHLDELVAQTSTKPPAREPFDFVLLRTVARALAQEGDAGAKKGAELLTAFDMIDVAPEVFAAAGRKEEFDLAELTFWKTRLEDSEVSDGTLKIAANSFAKLGDLESMRSALDKVSRKDSDLAKIMAKAGDTKPAITLMEDLLKAEKKRSGKLHPRSIALFENIRSYHAARLFRSGQIDEAQLLFDECLESCKQIRDDIISGEAWLQVLEARIGCGDLDGSIQSEPPKNDGWLKKRVIQTLIFGLAKANRLEEALAIAKSSSPSAMLSVCNGLVEGGHFKELETLIESSYAEAARSLALHPFKRRLKGSKLIAGSIGLRIVDDIDVWKYKNEIDPATGEYRFLSHIANNSDVPQLVKVVNASSRNFYTLARLMRKADREDDLLQMIELVSQSISAENSKPTFVTQVLHVLCELDRRPLAIAIGEKYIASVPTYHVVGSAKRKVGEKSLTWNYRDTHLFLQQWLLTLGEDRFVSESKELPKSLAGVANDLVLRRASDQLDKILNPTPPLPLSPARIAITEYPDRFSNSNRTYRRFMRSQN